MAKKRWVMLQLDLQTTALLIAGLEAGEARCDEYGDRHMEKLLIALRKKITKAMNQAT